MIEDVLKFQLDLTHFGQVVVPETHSLYCKRIALKLHQGIVAGCPDNPRGNPVDTGWARANWGVWIGKDDVPSQPMGSQPKKGSQKAMMAMPANSYFDPATILSVESLGKFPFIWVYNNVPYIEVLENGHSGQAPTGMVANALNSVQTFADSI